MTGPVIPHPGRESVARALGLLALGLALLGAGACGERSPASPSGTNEQPTVKFTSASFRARLIRTNGNLPSALGVSVPEFEARWRAFLHAEYGLPA